MSDHSGVTWMAKAKHDDILTQIFGLNNTICVFYPLIVCAIFLSDFVFEDIRESDNVVFFCIQIIYDNLTMWEVKMITFRLTMHLYYHLVESFSK
ncbi:hypothetical protein DERP_000483 [Dermatophagoides pteronyssinus]|uniref:Uncharacterized protein n=1 Tax=Dermatophagoides pteronyssinus TaxID=6956 RepID=A0ABQ8J0A4_DERPT|nr:hypothetical protein DERP_000483 [Dermatophagoides pteronyssinus]